MTRLTHRDFDACSRALLELHSETSLAASEERALAVVSSLVRCNVMSYDDWKLDDSGRPTSYRALRRPFVPEVDKFSPAMAACVHDHPLFSEAMAKLAPEPVKISDFATKNQLRRTAIYNEVYRYLEIESQIIITLSWKPNSRNYLVLNRNGRDFSERDRTILAFLAPHITQALQNASIAGGMASHLNVLGEGLDSMHRAVILAAPDGRIHWQTSLAREWLREFFPHQRTCDRLPLSLSNWLKRMEKESQRQRRPAFSEFQTAARADCRLLVYYGKSGSGEYVLTFVRERVKIDAATAHSLGLTPREAEILYWISEAKTRPEIGRILGVSWRTVGKHLEHLFAKLGVENRLEAQRIGLELRRM